VAQDFDGSLVAAATVVEPVELPYSADTVGETVDLFDFTLRDGGGGDALSLSVIQIVINVTGTANDTDRDKITWRLNGSDAGNVTGVYNAGADTLTFSGLSISIADGSEETYIINGYFNDNTDLTHGNSVILSIDGDTDLSVGDQGPQMGVTSAVNNSTGTKITDDIPPAVSEITPVLSPGNDSTPDVTLGSNETGNLDVAGSCGSSGEGHFTGNATITLTQPDNSTPLTAGIYSDCTAAITDDAGNVSNVLALSPFTIDLQAPSLVVNSGLSVGQGFTGVPVSLEKLQAEDDFSSPDGVFYIVSSSPAHGTLSMPANFNQADINAGLFTYSHDGSDAPSDSFEFQLSDEAGNSSGPHAFDISVFPVRPEPVTFLFNFAADAPSNAVAEGCIRLGGAAAEVPFHFDLGLAVQPPEVSALSVTVTGASAGNGTFGMHDFSTIAWSSNGGTLDLDSELIGQPTNGQPWGSVVEESGGDFNLFGTTPGAPVGVFWFVLGAVGGTADEMILRSMVRGNSGACDKIFSQSFETNIPPEVPATVVVEPSHPKTIQRLMCLASGSTDPDSEIVAYDYEWFINNVIVPSATTYRLESEFTARGQVVRCEARANDLEGGISQ
jgi:hypothetical protein